MNSVNRYFLDDVLGPLTGLADSPEDVHLYSNINSDDELEIKRLFTKIIKPDFNSKIDKVKIEIKKALSFYLTTNKVDFKKVFNSNLLPISQPSNTRLFFVWLWEVLFVNEKYDNIDINSFYEKNDLTEPWKILL